MTRTEVCAQAQHDRCSGMVVQPSMLGLKPCECRCHGGGSVKRLYGRTPEERAAAWADDEQAAA